MSLDAASTTGTLQRPSAGRWPASFGAGRAEHRAGSSGLRRAHGSPYTRFRRALAARNPLLVTAAALELGRLSLADALAVCLVFRDHDRERYERAAVRWLARFCQQTPGVAARDAQLALAALAALTGPARHGAARALAELAEAYGHDDVAQILDEWLDDRPGDT